MLLVRVVTVYRSIVDHIHPFTLRPGQDGTVDVTAHAYDEPRPGFHNVGRLTTATASHDGLPV